MMPRNFSDDSCPHCGHGRDEPKATNGFRCVTCRQEWWRPRNEAEVIDTVAAQIEEAGGRGPFTLGDIEVSEECFRMYWGLLPLPPSSPSLLPPSPPTSPEPSMMYANIKASETIDESVGKNDEERLAELLLQWEEAAEVGQRLSAGELCSACPHLASRLAERITALESLLWLNRSEAAAPNADANVWKSIWNRGDEPIPGYTLLRLLGHGSFGEVWSTRGPDGALHAIKIVDQPSKSEQEQRGLRRIVNVRHPFVLSIELVQVVSEKLMIVTELAECSLHDVFTRRRRMLSVIQDRRQANAMYATIHHEVLRMLLDAAEALDYMREDFRLLHLDVKPTNLMIINGRCKVGDFGTISRLVSPLDTPTSPMHTVRVEPNPRPVAQSADKGGLKGGTRITNSGAFTHKYAPPEAYRGEFSSTHDQYSLAMTYCELLTGRVPFTGEWDEQVLQRSMHRMNVAILPPEVRLVATRALASNPAERYSSCVEFVESLFRALDVGTVESSYTELLASNRDLGD